MIARQRLQKKGGLCIWRIEARLRSAQSGGTACRDPFNGAASAFAISRQFRAACCSRKMLAEEFHHALGRGVVEKPFEVLCSFASEFLTSGEEFVFIGSKCGFAVPRKGD